MGKKRFVLPLIELKILISTIGVSPYDITTNGGNSREFISREAMTLLPIVLRIPDNLFLIFVSLLKFKRYNYSVKWLEMPANFVMS